MDAIGYVRWAWLVLSLAACDGAMVAPADGGGTCGDGVRDLGEGCDDGNTETGDGCSAHCRREVGGALAAEVIEAPGGTGSGFGDPSRATNGVRGGGEAMQSLDVYSIALDGYLVLGFEGRRLIDGPGDDLAVFENPFRHGDGQAFIDAAIVELSDDGEVWVPFAHDYRAPDETRYSSDPAHWVGFAGVEPVFLHADTNVIDPFDPGAGGDRFDLADLVPSAEADRIRREGARYVRITAAFARENPDTGAPYPIDAVSNGPDIDGVAARWLAEDP